MIKYIAKMLVLIMTQFLATTGVAYGSFATPILAVQILQKKFTLTTAYYYALAWVLVPGIIGLLGTLLLIDALLSNCMLFSTYKEPTVYILTILSISTGISTAFFTYLITKISLLISLPPLALVVIAPFFFIAYIVTFVQIVSTVLFSEKEAVVLGGSLTITAIGILAMSMGITLLTLPNNAVNFSTAAGSIIGSGLTLIAMGLQRYYEEKEKRVHG